jgi:hypothetical protein
MSATKILVASFGLGFFVWLIPSSIDIIAWSRGGIDRFAILAPLYALWPALAASAVLAAAVWWAGARTEAARGHRAFVLAPAAALWLWTVPFLPWLPSRFPLLLILAGPVRWAVPAAVLAAVVFRARTLRMTAGKAWVPLSEWLARRGRTTVFAVSLVLFLLLGTRSLQVLGLDGDEPHYLIITQSLLVDHDIRIENNHARGDYRAFFPRDLRPDYLQRGLNGQIYSIHAPGLPALMLPGYAVAGRWGAVATLCLFAAVAAAAIFEAALLVGGALVAWATWASVCLSVPFLPHAWSLYPEMGGAAVVALAVLWVIRRRQASAIVWFGRGVLIAVLPWMHTKFIVLLAALTLWLLVELRARVKPSLAFLAPIAVSCAAWLAFFYVIYGTINPQAPYGGHTAEFVRVANVPRSLLGLLFDQKFGLLVYSPIYLAAIAGAWLLLRDARRRVLGGVLLGIAVAYSLSSAREYMWWGGSSAPARYLVPVVPLAAPMIATAFARLKKAGRPMLLVALSIAGVVVSMAWLGGPDRGVLFSDAHGTSRLFELIEGGAPLTAAFPTFTEENWGTPILHMLPWVAAVLSGLAVVWLAPASRSRFWTIVAGGTTFVVAAAVLAAPIPTEARLDAAARGRLTIGQKFDPGRLRAFDYATHAKVTAVQWAAAAGVTVGLDPSQLADPSGRLTDALPLAPGSYTASVWFQGNRAYDGDLLLVMHNGQVFRRVPGPLPNPTVVSFSMPIELSSLAVQLTDVASAQQAVRVEFQPTALVPASQRVQLDVHAIEPVPEVPGAYMEYVDDWTFPEGGVFWTNGTHEGQVVVVPAGGATMLLTLHVGPNRGAVHIKVGEKAQDVQLEAEETRTLSIPLPPGATYVPVSVQAAADFRPSDVSPSSSDLRYLGCQVRVAVR